MQSKPKCWNVISRSLLRYDVNEIVEIWGWRVCWDLRLTSFFVSTWWGRWWFCWYQTFDRPMLVCRRLRLPPPPTELTTPWPPSSNAKGGCVYRLCVLWRLHICSVDAHFCSQCTLYIYVKTGLFVERLLVVGKQRSHKSKRNLDFPQDTWSWNPR